jgi:hypothetical protein
VVPLAPTVQGEGDTAAPIADIEQGDWFRD